MPSLRSTILTSRAHSWLEVSLHNLVTFRIASRFSSFLNANGNVDNQLTDIAFGNNSGIRTLLVLGGVTHEDQVWGPKASDIKPTYVMNSLGDFATLAE